MKSNEKISIALLIATHIVGIIGFIIPNFKEIFLYLTPFNLLLTFILIYWGGNYNNKSFIRASSLIFLLGFGIEVLGVKTGIIFGEYSYGEPLGVQLYGVPLIIGVNWFILTYASNAVASYLSNNIWWRVIIGSLLMVGIDFLIEPVAITSDFWTWESGFVPIQNYIMWFIVSLLAQFLLEFNLKTKHLKIGLTVFAVQVLFFLVLNFIS